MKGIKKFFSKAKANQHFKNSGPGQRLNDDVEGAAGPAPGAQADRNLQAEALQKRLNAMQPTSSQDAARKKIQMMAKRQLEEERQQMEAMNLSNEQQPEPKKEQELDHSSILPGVLFYSELLGEEHARSKPELIADMKQYLVEQIAEADDDDKISGSVLMLYTLNKRETKDIAIETISRLVNNILDKPNEERVKKIRLTNENIVKKVIDPPGSRSFLESIGFREQMIQDEGQMVPWLVYTGDLSTSGRQRLLEALDELNAGEAVPIKVSRSLEVFQLKPGQEVKAPKVPDGFYNLSAAEIKAEQANKTKEMDKMLTLRTKEMRDRDAKLTNTKYRYTAIRVRLPGNFAVQGTFSVYEPFSAVREFVSGTLSAAVAAYEFRLHDRIQQHVDDETVSLLELGLVPSAYLHLTFLENVNNSVEIIAEEHLGLVHDLED